MGGLVEEYKYFVRRVGESVVIFHVVVESSKLYNTYTTNQYAFN
jgi:hypothetical protein